MCYTYQQDLQQSKTLFHQIIPNSKRIALYHSTRIWYNIEKVDVTIGTPPTSSINKQVLTHLSDKNIAILHNMYTIIEQNNSLQQQFYELQQQIMMLATAPAVPQLVLPPPISPLLHMPSSVTYQIQTKWSRHHHIHTKCSHPHLQRRRYHKCHPYDQ